MSDPLSPQSDDLREFYSSAPPDLIAYDTLEFNHPDFDQPGRVVNDSADLAATLESDAPFNASTEVTFNRCKFICTLPEQSTPGLPSFNLEIENVARILMPYLDLAASSDQPVNVIYRQFLSSDLSAPQLVLAGLTLQKANAGGLKVTGAAGYQNFLYQPSPKRKYTTKEFPGLAR